MMRPSSASGGQRLTGTSSFLTTPGLLCRRLCLFGGNVYRLRCWRGCWRSRHFLTEVLLGRLQCRDGLCHLVLLARELILIGCELLFASPDKCEVNRHRFKLLL